jgi:hypothetical protein
MSFLNQWKLAIFVDSTTTPDAADFRRRVQVAMSKVALSVAGEPQDTMKYDQWLKRGELATNVLRDSLAWLDAFALATVTNASITATSLDSDIEFQVTAEWDDIAGVTGRDLL